MSPKLAAIIADLTDEGSPAISSSSSVNDNEERIALTARELEVLRLLVQGLANKEISARMGISESAVRNALQQLFGKTAVGTRG